MTAPRVTPKVMTVPEAEGIHETRTGVRGGAIESDSFISSAADPWKALVSSGIDETPSEIGPLMDAMHDTRERRRNSRDAMQDFLDGMTMGDYSGSMLPSSADFSVPQVPKVSDLAKDRSIFNNMEPVVERFTALEQTYVFMLDEAKESTRHGMNTKEIETQMEYIQVLKDGLILVRHELQEARQFLDWQRARERAARAET